MRDRATDECDLARAGDTKIGDILPAPTQEAVILLAEHRSADAASRHG
jgi:hypothetical protein